MPNHGEILTPFNDTRGISLSSRERTMSSPSLTSGERGGILFSLLWSAMTNHRQQPDNKKKMLLPAWQVLPSSAGPLESSEGERPPFQQ